MLDFSKEMMDFNAFYIWSSGSLLELKEGIANIGSKAGAMIIKSERMSLLRSCVKNE